VQSTADFRAGGVEHTLVFGAEAGRGTSDAGGCGTSPSDLSACDPASFLASENSTRRDDLAVFIQENAHLGGGVTLLAGARWDRSRYGYQESVPDPSNDSDRTFSETSWKGGIAWNGSGAIGLYANYGESFQPPTVEELFAFPGFGSNPDLEPVSARNYELGLRGALTGAAAASTPGFDYALSVFRTNLANEIIFTPRPTPQDPYAGTNENVGRSYREGVELTAGWRPARWVAVTAALSWTRARFVCSSADPPGSARCAASPDAPGGNEVPLVPDHRYAVAATFSATRDLDLRLELLQVGSQVLANDEANAVQRLDPYFVANARASWRASRRWELYAEVRNLLDEEYATRGIYAFDFSTFAGAVFVTPAPPRTFVAGAGFAF
jgi:outer membrane receptor protein involved in Fe transport